jgi:aminoglycoside phosphotransferase (APT) family kinase protein
MRCVSKVPRGRMHEGEIETDVDLVRRLLLSQHPQWADLPIEPVSSAGTDNAIYRLGDELAVRLPRIDRAVECVAKEQQWLPFLAPRVPLAIPMPVAVGEPEAVFPYPWGVVKWVPGHLATLDQLDDPVQSALELGAFVRALQAVDPSGGPEHPRGRPVRLQEDMVRFGLAHLRGEVDADAVADAWNRVLAAPDHTGPPVWFHGDLSYLNVLAEHGALTAVIDWGTCAVGDPAIETIIAWSLFPRDARQAYRGAIGVDDATWERGKGWILTGVYGIDYYRDTNPVLVANIVKGIQAVLDDRD